jgi:hypothetical protein
MKPRRECHCGVVALIIALAFAASCARDNAFEAQVADSEGCRSAFRTDADHDSEVMPISVPN